jgi:hypothetical protein
MTWEGTVIVSSGPARVIGAGVATTFGGHPLVLEVPLDGESLVVELAFVTDAASQVASVEPAMLERGYRLRCTNFDGGRGTAEPVLLGEAGSAGEDLVFLHFFAHRYGKALDTTVQFTLYRVAKPAVGWVPAGG